MHSISIAARSMYFFFFNDTATTEIYTLSLHDALPISLTRASAKRNVFWKSAPGAAPENAATKIESLHARGLIRSEEHTSELQSQSNLVCRLLLEKKKKHEYYQQRKCTA